MPSKYLKHEAISHTYTGTYCLNMALTYIFVTLYKAMLYYRTEHVQILYPHTHLLSCEVVNNSKARIQCLNQVLIIDGKPWICRHQQSRL